MELRSAEEWFQAVEERNMEKIMYNMSNFHRVTTIDGNTALILAAGRNHPEIVRILAQLEYGMRNKQGYTALMAAAMYDSAECCEILLPFEKEFRLRDGGTALMIAAAVGSLNAFVVLFPALGDTIDTAGRGVLSIAASAGQLEVIKQILPIKDDYQNRKLPHDMRAAIQIATANKHMEVAEYLHKILTNHGTLDSTINPLTPRMKSLRELAHPAFNSDMVNDLTMTKDGEGISTLGYTIPFTSNHSNPQNLSLSTREFQDTIQCEHNPDEICDQCLKRINELNPSPQYNNLTSRKSTIKPGTNTMRSSSQQKSDSRASSINSPSTRSFLGIARSGIGGGNYSKYDNYIHNTKSQLFHEANARAASRSFSAERSMRSSSTGTRSFSPQVESTRHSQVSKYPKSAKAAKLPFNSDFMAALQDNRIPDIKRERPYNPVKPKSHSQSNRSKSSGNSKPNLNASTSSVSPVGITTLVGVDSPSFVRSTRIDDLPGKKTYKYVTSKVDSGIGNKMMPYDFQSLNSYRNSIASMLSPTFSGENISASPLSYHDEPGVECNRTDEDEIYAQPQQQSIVAESKKSSISPARSSTKSSIHRESTPLTDYSPASFSQMTLPIKNTIKDDDSGSSRRSTSAHTRDLTTSKLTASLTNWQQDKLAQSTLEASIRERRANRAPYSTKSLQRIRSTGYTESPTQGVTPPQFYVRPVNRFEKDKKMITIEQPYKDVLPAAMGERETHLERLSRPRSVTKVIRQPLHISKKESNLMDDLRKTLAKTLRNQTLQATKPTIRTTTGPKTPGEALCDTLNRDISLFAGDGLSEERQYVDIPYTHAEGQRLLAQYPESPMYYQDEVLNHKEPDLCISESSTDLMRKICSGEWSTNSTMDRSPTPKKRKTSPAETPKNISELSDAGKQANDGSTALMFAAKYNNVNAAKKVIATEAGMTMRSGHTALMISCIQGSTDTALMLTEKERCIQTKDGWTALMLCVKYNRYEIATKLVPHECGSKNNMGNTALMIAACTGAVHFGTLLHNYEKGVQNSTGRTALMAAVNFNCAPLVRILAEAEAGMQDNEGTTALMVAAQQNKLEFVKILAPYEAKLRGSMLRTAMMMATKLGFSRIVAELCELEGGFQDSDGWTALIIAALMNNISIVEILREKESGLQTKKGWTALMLASRCGYIEVVNLLIHREAGIQMENGWCAIMSASINGYTDIVKLLYPYEGQLKDNKGNTPMSIAFKRGYTELYNVLNELSLGKEAPWKPI